MVLKSAARTCHKCRHPKVHRKDGAISVAKCSKRDTLFSTSSDWSQAKTCADFNASESILDNYLLFDELSYRYKVLNEAIGNNETNSVVITEGKGSEFESKSLNMSEMVAAEAIISIENGIMRLIELAESAIKEVEKERTGSDHTCYSDKNNQCRICDREMGE